MKKWSSLAAVFGIILCGLTSSCIRTSTVVKVKKDGSGEIVSRYYFSPKVIAMLEQFEAVGVPAAANAGAPDFGIIREIVSPDRESLEADSENYGEGVVYSKHETGKDGENWEGYTVVYAFDDVSKVRIDQNSVPGKAKQFVEASGQDLNADKGGRLTFAMNDGELVIRSTLAEGSIEGLVDEDQIAQANQMGVKPSEGLKMAANSMEGMRAGFFIRIEDGIAETNAEHVTGNLIIMSDAEVSKVMRDPDFSAFIDEAAKDPGKVTKESVKELFREIEAMTMEMSEEITVRFQ